MLTENFNYKITPTEFITAENGIKYAYRRLGSKKEIPIIYFNHLTANLDNCDPRVMDGMAKDVENISFDYRGVGQTSGEDAPSIQDMAKDAIAKIEEVLA